MVCVLEMSRLLQTAKGKSLFKVRGDRHGHGKRCEGRSGALLLE